ncbi:MAG TPA: FadD3 family acyl-CoA ligase [Solirubrobacterales bacterium]
MSDHPQTLPALLAHAVSEHAERIAVIDGNTRLTYAELGEQVDRAARGLIAAGVEPGDRVCIWSPNTYHWIVAALALHSAGAVLVTLNTRFTGAEAFDILERTSTRVLFLPDRFLDNDYLATLRGAERAVGTSDEAAGEGAAGDGRGPVPGLPALELVVRTPIEGGEEAPEPGVCSWEELLARAPEVDDATAAARREAVGPEDISDILFTSGTTGRPKGAMSAQRQTLAVAEAWADCAEVSARDVYMIIAPFFHTFGYKAGWVVCLLRGATILPMITFDLDAVVDTIERDRVTIVPGPPTVFQTLLAYPGRERRDLSSLRLAVTGAAVVPVTLVERMQHELSFEMVITAYGLSEAVVVTMCRSGDDPATIAHTSGAPTGDFEVRIAGDDGAVLPAGESGEIQLRGPNVMLGYLDDPEATRNAIEPDGWFHTGDIGHLDERGYLTITDRLKDMLTVGGFNVYPAEVENAILGLDGVVECAVVGAHDERLGEVGLAYVVAKPDHSLEPEAVIAACRERLANFKVPRRVEIVDELPHNASGKVLKTELRARAAAAS